MASQDCETFTFTRREFYDRVWSMPATKLGVELGCSDVMIGKVCRAFDVPKPYLGYWAKLEHGKSPRRTPLPENDDPALQTLTFRKYADGRTDNAEPEPEYDQDIRQLLDTARALPPVAVAEALRNPHPLVAYTRDYLQENSRLEALPYLRRPEAKLDRKKALSVSVGKEQLGRALRILDALIKRIEKIGGRVEVQQGDWHHHTVVILAGEVVPTLRLREKQNQVRVPKEKQPKEKWAFRRAFDLVPSGLLILEGGESWHRDISLRDLPSGRKRIEDGLDDFVLELIRRAGMQRIRKAQERLRLERAEELRRRQAELAKRQAAEQAKVDQLLQHANAWQQAQLIRDYLDALIKAAGDPEAASEFVRWARDQADRIDPLRSSPSSVLDERGERLSSP